MAKKNTNQIWNYEVSAEIYKSTLVYVMYTTVKFKVLYIQVRSGGECVMVWVESAPVASKKIE